MRKDNKNVCFN